MKIKKMKFGFAALILLTVMFSVSSPVFAFDINVPSEGLEAKASGTYAGQALSIHLTYTHSSGNIYHAHVAMTGYLDGYMAWNVDSITRVISSPTSDMGFALVSGSHDMCWIIITGVSIGNYIPLSTNGYGDYSYEVIAQEIITTAGASTTCWKLEHADSGSLMWFDVDSGINLKGIMDIGGGYFMEWTVTELITPGIPGFELLFVVISIAVAFLTILTWKKISIIKGYPIKEIKFD
ncbi:MAG: hypothetical protein ACFFBT_02035 [Promethearchaeota archaeon]